ncbi:MAG TPA: lysophospholipid acyltransferase family protein [Stellaceae bacterium]|nr:lysophospholipid acyltransferase family protein [Stellaceae bacterium]
MVADPRNRLRQFVQYWMLDPAMGLLNTTIHESLKLLSIDGCSAFGAFISPFSAKRFPISDARARRLWQRLRPEAADPVSTDAAMRRLWRSVSRTMCEFSVLHRLWPAGRVAVDGVEHLEAVRRAGKPMIIAGLHLGNWETIPATGIALGYPGSGFYWPLENRFDTRIAVRARERYGAVLFPASPQAMRPAMKAAIAALNANKGPFVIFIDECIDEHVFAPAFGRPLKPEGNIANVAWLAWTTGAEVLPAYCVRIDDSARFRITVLPPVALARGGDRRGDLVTNIARINAVIEPVIREHLDQWYYALDLELDG